MTDPLHIQLAARPTVDDWQPDCVMDGYQQATIHLGHDDEGDIVATFVRRDPSKLPMSARWRRQRFALRGHRLAVMYVHGWNDYFYRRHESEFWESLGIPFYAVDLRKFGRSLRDGQTPGYIEDLHDYAAELNAGLALAGIARQPHVPYTVDARGSGVPAGRRQNGDADA